MEFENDVNFDMTSYGELLARFVGSGNNLTEDITETPIKKHIVMYRYI